MIHLRQTLQIGVWFQSRKIKKGLIQVTWRWDVNLHLNIYYWCNISPFLSTPFFHNPFSRIIIYTTYALTPWSQATNPQGLCALYLKQRYRAIYILHLCTLCKNIDNWRLLEKESHILDHKKTSDKKKRERARIWRIKNRGKEWDDLG